jgi:hypothetical protein
MSSREPGRLALAGALEEDIFRTMQPPAKVMDAPRYEHGGVAERLKAPVLKSVSGESRSWVRIPPPPPTSPVSADSPPESAE